MPAVIAPIAASFAAPAAAPLITPMMALSVAMMGMSVLSSIQAGYAQQSMMNFQATQSSLNAQAEEIKGRQDALKIKENRDKALASLNAGFAARGGITGSGTPFAAMVESNRAASEDINLALFGAQTRAASDISQAAQLKAEGSAAVRGGYMNALSTIARSSPVQNKLSSLLD